MSSIFGDTYRGVPNPLVAHTHPYPTRFHGPKYGLVQASPVYQPASWAVPPFNGLGACCDSCAKGGPCAGGSSLQGPFQSLGACAPCAAAAALAGDSAPLLCASTGHMATDAILGAVVGGVLARPDDRVAWAAGGAAVGALAGIVGIVAAAGAALFVGRR